MNFNNLSDNVKRSFNKVSFSIKEASPEIFMVAGITGMIVAGVTACFATTKAGAILDEAKDKLESVHVVSESEKYSEEYTENDRKRDLAIIYAQTGFNFVKLYGPSIAIAGCSIAAIVSGNRILNSRNAALAAAYTTLDQGFKNYRKNVISRFGENVDRELKYGIKSEKITEVETDESGNEKKVKKTVEVIDANNNLIECSPYAKYFDDASFAWTKSSDYNLAFLRSQQNYFNDLLISRGHVFLNEIYDALGFPHTSSGAVVGWIYDPENAQENNYIDFGIYNIRRQSSRDFVNGYENVILLDFNVQGVIYNRI